MTPPPPLLHCTVLYYTLLYMGVLRVAINISISYDSNWVTYCFSYIFCHKTGKCGRISEFEVTIELYLCVLLYWNLK